MPLLRFDLIEGRTPAEITTLLDAAHRAIVTAFGVPERDRYQIVHEHSPAHLIVQDTGLGIARSEKVVVITVTSRPRGQESKLNFYKELCRELMASCGITPNDVMARSFEKSCQMNSTS